MKKKYNLALIPLSKTNEIITLAQKFSALADQYLLNGQSLPHVTLYQFEYEEHSIAEIWEKVTEFWHEKILELEFKQFSFVTFDEIIFWISLLPNNLNVLNELHTDIATLLQLPVKKYFDPHMTLINSKKREYKETALMISESYKMITDEFKLILGCSDEMGQLTEIIYN